jgi:hypothetical protein
MSHHDDDFEITVSFDQPTMPPSAASRTKVRSLMAQLDGLHDLPERMPTRVKPR